MFYTLICYKPSSDDYCMGCHMASYSSDFELISTENEAEIIEGWAAKLYANDHLDTGESGYEMTLQLNGKTSDYLWSELYRAETDEAEAPIKAQQDLMADIEARATLRYKEMVEAEQLAQKRREAEEKQAAEALKAKKAAEKERKEYKDYLKAKAKYEGGNHA